MYEWRIRHRNKHVGIPAIFLANLRFRQFACLAFPATLQSLEDQSLRRPRWRRDHLAQAILENVGLPAGRRRVGYARVSTNDQQPTLQIDALKAAHCTRIFVETASGVTNNRDQLRAAINETRQGDVLVVWRLDRLGRSLLHMIETVRDLDHRNVGFLSLTENIDTTTSTGRLVLHIFGAIAEFERAMMVERTVAGLEAARARGRVGGRRRKLSDEDIEAGMTLIHGGNAPIADVARELGVSLSTLYRYFPACKAQRARRRRQ